MTQFDTESEQLDAPLVITEEQVRKLKERMTGKLTSFVTRIERLTAEKKGLSEDIAEVFKEVKSAGYDVKALRAVIKFRATPAHELKAQQELFDLYIAEVGA